jgi:hypothetical protein
MIYVVQCPEGFKPVSMVILCCDYIYKFEYALLFAAGLTWIRVNL